MNTHENDSLTITLSDGRTLGYALYGNPKGSPVFYFHGWPGSRLRSKVIADAATQANVYLITPDRPGYGISTFQPKRTLLDWANDVNELATSLSLKKFSVLGVSGGGPYTAVCAHELSDRLKNAGIVVGLAPPYMPKTLDGMNLFTKFGYRYYRTFPILAQLGALYQMILAQYFTKFTALNYPADVDKAMVKKLHADIIENDREAFRQGFKGAALDLMLYSRHWGFELSNIKTNVHLWYGDADKNVPLSMAHTYKNQIPSSTLTIYPNEGHFVSVTHAQEILERIK